MPDPYTSACAWYAVTTALRVEQVRQLGPGGWSLRTPGWPRSFVHNCLLLTGDPGPQTALDWVEQSGAGLDHRHTVAYCHLSSSTLQSLAANGFVQTELVMSRPTSGPAILAPAGVKVAQVAPDHPAVLALHSRFWREEWMPEADDATVHELVGRRSAMDLAGSVTSLVVRDDDAVVASIDVCVRDGVAELDALATLRSHRGQGCATALFARGIEFARAAGSELVVLTALTDDWPWEWYARLGFEVLGPATEATAHPVDPASPPVG